MPTLLDQYGQWRLTALQRGHNVRELRADLAQLISQLLRGFGRHVGGARKRRRRHGCFLLTRFDLGQLVEQWAQGVRVDAACGEQRFEVRRLALACRLKARDGALDRIGSALGRRVNLLAGLLGLSPRIGERVADFLAG